MTKNVEEKTVQPENVATRKPSLPRQRGHSRTTRSPSCGTEVVSPRCQSGRSVNRGTEETMEETVQDTTKRNHEKTIEEKEKGEGKKKRKRGPKVKKHKK